jgi:hypothetical protein
MLNNELTQRMNYVKSRMEAIATIRPSNMELIEEFMLLKKELVESERKLSEIEGKEFATPLEAPPTWWDNRTQKVLLFSDCSTRRKTTLAFRHASKPMGPEDHVTAIMFENVLASRAKVVSSDESFNYSSGIVGIDRLGIFQVQNSKWLIDILNDQQEAMFHYCIVFTHHLFEFLSTNYNIKSADTKAQGADIFLQEISLPW